MTALNTAVLCDYHSPTTHALKLTKLGSKLAVYAGDKLVVVDPAQLGVILASMFGVGDEYQDLVTYCERLEAHLSVCECGGGQ